MVGSVDMSVSLGGSSMLLALYSKTASYQITCLYRLQGSVRSNEFYGEKSEE
jgi:hypothetical protein